jgi:hypothetical protein
MIGFNGGLIGGLANARDTSAVSAVGVWTLAEQRKAKLADLWPIVTDFVVASGGTVSDITDGGFNYRLHAFTATGNSTFTVASPGEVEYLVVAGGGAGGCNVVGATNSADGGSAGQFLEGTLEVSIAAITVTVGAGGTGVSGANGGNGGNSVFSTVTASGGTGGLGLRSSVTNGGAGGTGTAGGTGISPNAGAGGAGGTSTITSVSTVYAGGGGGGFTNGGLGGAGGGGRGESFSTGNAAAGETNKGGGGGGISNSLGPAAGKNGGSGVVYIRYRIPA